MKSFFRGFFLTILIVALIAGGAFFFTSGSVPFLGGPSSMDVLVVGVDALNQNKKGVRSDVMMIVHMDLEGKGVSLFSVPRDTRTKISGRKHKEKMNHAYAYGGIEKTLETVNNRLGLNLEKYVVVDYGFVEHMVDMMGGVDVNVPMAMHYEDPTADPPLLIDLQPGEQTLDGAHAIQFLRFRKGYANADLGRVEAQQQFMASALAKLKSPMTVLKAPLYYMAFRDETNSNLTTKDLLAIGRLATGLSRENISHQTLPGSPKMISHVSYFILDDDATDELFRSRGMK